MFKKIKQLFRKWGAKMKGLNLINHLAIDDLDTKSYARIKDWKDIYSGEKREFNTVQQFTIENGKSKRPRHQFNMARVAANELAKLVFTDKVLINVDDDKLAKDTDKLLKDNRFYRNFRDKVEVMLALGGQVIKANPYRKKNGEYGVKVIYISPDTFIPLEWEEDLVTEAAFLNVTKKDDKAYVLVETHRWEMRKQANDEGVEYGEESLAIVIRNELFETEEVPGETANLLEMDLVPVPLEFLYEDLQYETIVFNIDTPLFRYIKAPGVNNFDVNSPFGLAVFANAYDTLLALNIAFDSFIREFEIGKRRIIVPVEAVQFVPHPVTGQPIRYFDASDEAFMAMKSADPEKQKIVDNTVSIRVDEMLKSINGLLDIFAMQIGMSAGSFTFDGQTIKTATEVISENSKTYQTVIDICNTLEDNLIGFIKVLLQLGYVYEVIDTDIPDDLEITMTWDDSVIGDKYTDATFYTGLVINQMMSKREAMRRIMNMTDEQIDTMFEEIRQEQPTAPNFEEVFKTDSEVV